MAATWAKKSSRVGCSGEESASRLWNYIVGDLGSVFRCTEPEEQLTVCHPVGCLERLTPQRGQPCAMAMGIQPARFEIIVCLCALTPLKELDQVGYLFLQ